MKEMIIIFILLILITLFCIYLILWALWRKIDIISFDTAEYIKKQYDSGFDPGCFRSEVRKIIDALSFLGENRVIFHTPFYERRKSPGTLNAHTGLPGHRLILFTPGWAARLDREFSKTQEYDCRGTMTNLFIFALGHEMAHKEAQYKPLFLFGRKRICAGWLREIDADLEGMRKAGLTPEEVISCIKKEIPLTKSLQYGDRKEKRLKRHPTWEYRMTCIEKGKLSDTMIEKIFKDCGVNDIRFCEKVKKRYADRQDPDKSRSVSA